MSLLARPFGGSTKPENRRHCRIPARCRIPLALLTYTSEGGAQTVWTRALDLSGAGLMVSSHRALEVGSVAFIRFENLHFLVGWAHVSHCTRRARTYRIGLEFRKPVASRF